jgi:hypothetical protein
MYSLKIWRLRKKILALSKLFISHTRIDFIGSGSDIGYIRARYRESDPGIRFPGWKNLYDVVISPFWAFFSVLKKFVNGGIRTALRSPPAKPESLALHHGGKPLLINFGKKNFFYPTSGGLKIKCLALIGFGWMIYRSNGKTLGRLKN